jgi:UDP-N-acetylmuramate: L-alanyl-gamma-D-glutamyl-meso-diaminopimelate ligase
MASLAGMLQARGHQVTGSDQNVYPPMSTQLQELGIEILAG